MEVLIVDDEQDIRHLVSGVLDDEGYETRTAGGSIAALAAIDERRPDLVLLDVWLRGSPMDGIEMLREIKKRDPNLPVIIFSGHGNLDTAVAAINEGAVDFIEKPFMTEKLLHLVERATETERLRQENNAFKEKFGLDNELTGTSNIIRTVRAKLKKVAASGSRIMILGPAGVGKEVAARMVHNWSPRANSKFISVNSGRLDPDKFEEQLFGSESGGKLKHVGLMELAHGGTLFLDEIADMPAPTQAKILRVLTDQSFVRVGGERQIHVDVRVISTSSKDLAAEIEAKRLREDLYYRLNVVPIDLPQLTDRREDISDLADFFLIRYANQHDMIPPKITDEAMAAMQAYEWPGNVRQLKNMIERIVIFAPTKNLDVIDLTNLPTEIIGGVEGPNNNISSLMGMPLREARETFEREYLKVQINRFSGNISRTAGFIGMERSALHRKLKLLGLYEKDKNNKS